MIKRCVYKQGLAGEGAARFCAKEKSGCSIATIISCLYHTDKTKVNIIPKNFISNLKKKQEKYDEARTSVNRITEEMQKIFN